MLFYYFFALLYWSAMENIIQLIAGFFGLRKLNEPEKKAQPSGGG